MLERDKIMYVVSLFFTVMILSSCSIMIKNPMDLLINDKFTLSMDDKAKQYPYFNVEFDGFEVWDAPASMPNPTPEDHRRALIFNIVEKKYMLRNLDFVRFVLNTPEFEKELYEKPMYLARVYEGPLGSNKLGDLADPKLLMAILQKFSYRVNIIKLAIKNGAAVGVVGPPRYNTLPSDINSFGLWIGFPNSARMDQGGYIKDSYYHSGNVLHEVLHNLGFTHSSSVKKPDTVDGITAAYKKFARDEKFLKKYRKELATFRPFYEEKHKDWLVEDTANNTRNRSNQGDVSSFLKNDQIICVIQEDGSYRMMTVAEYRKTL